MKDYAFMYKSLIKEVAKFENKQVADSMSRLGLNYIINFGLSLNQLDDIANIVDKDDTFAQYLWQRNEREAKLIALRIFETQDFVVSDIEDFTKGITNLELAEQSAMRLFSKQNNAVDLALNMLEYDGFIQLTAYWTIARFVMLNKNAKPAIFMNLLTEILKHEPRDKAIYFKRGFAQALLRIGLINKNLAEKVQEYIEKIAMNDKEFAEYLQQEVSYLITNN